MVDHRGMLKENPFDYKQRKDSQIFIYWNGKHIKTVGGKDAAKLLTRLENATEDNRQLILAKVTGNFKRGNEKAAK